MKKLFLSSLILLTALMLLFTLTACLNPSTSTPPASDPESNPPPSFNPADHLLFGVQYLRTGFREDLHNPSVTVIRTRRELDIYLDTFPCPDASWDNDPTLMQICERYNEEYFADRDLIVVLVEEGSGSIRHKVNAVYRNSATGEWAIDIERLIPEIGTADMAGWHIFIEPSKEMRVQEGDTFKIGDHTLSPLPLDTFGYYWGDVQYVRTTGHAPDTEFPSSLIIRSKQELLDYYENNKAYYTMDSSWDESPAFRDAIERYDDAYFADRELLIVRIEEPSGSIRHKVNFMRENYSEGAWEVSITSFKSMYETEDMEQWHILIEMPEMLHTEPSEQITLLFKER